VFRGTLTVIDALPDAQSAVAGSPFKALEEENRHVVVPCTTARSRKLPPDAGSVVGVVAKRALLASVAFPSCCVLRGTASAVGTLSDVSAVEACIEIACSAGELLCAGRNVASAQAQPAEAASSDASANRRLRRRPARRRRVGCGLVDCGSSRTPGCAGRTRRGWSAVSVWRSKRRAPPLSGRLAVGLLALLTARSSFRGRSIWVGGGSGRVSLLGVRSVHTLT
jgi:hypothetical protein